MKGYVGTTATGHSWYLGEEYSQCSLPASSTLQSSNPYPRASLSKRGYVLEFRSLLLCNIPPDTSTFPYQNQNPHLSYRCPSSQSGFLRPQHPPPSRPSKLQTTPLNPYHNPPQSGNSFPRSTANPVPVLKAPEPAGSRSYDAV